ncbi:MAG: sterol desaturase family protein [Acidimicrobiia bacterium]|nr:sterol desaturase family protein [Acidimicrobiia bacterium]
MEDRIQQIIDVLEFAFVPILLIELVWLWRRADLSWGRVKEMLANTSSLLFVIPAGALGVAIWFALFERIAGAMAWSIPLNWWTALIAVLLADFIYYWEHRFEHEHRLPWDLYHSVHHSSETYDQTTGLRLGFFDALLTVGFSLPLVLVGFSPTVALLATGVVVGYQTWIHTEVVRTLPAWVEAVFNTASHHRAHHGADQHYLDVNYGGILIIWDRLFGTFQAETNRPNYGLTTQIESSNPFDIQFSQLRLLWSDLQSDTSWRTRLRRLWNKPGWHPAATVSV